MIHSSADAANLALTLSALVPAVAEGLLSHAVVVFDRPDAGAERIADAMGASVVTGADAHWRRGAQAARGDWVLLLRAGEEPEQGWIGAVERHLMVHAVSGRRPALLPLTRPLAALGERMALLLRAAEPRAGLIAPRALIAAGQAPGAPVRLQAGRYPAAR